MRWYDDTMLDRYLHRVFRQEIHEDNRANRAEHRRILHEVGDATDFDD